MNDIFIEQKSPFRLSKLFTKRTRDGVTPSQIADLIDNYVAKQKENANV